MPRIASTELIRTDLFTDRETLEKTYSAATVERIVRLRDMYNWQLNNPDARDRVFIDEMTQRHHISKSQAYTELSILKTLIPNIAKNSRDFHRWRFNEMILETYRMAKQRKDTKTMEKAASSYAKFNRVDIDEENELPYDKIVVQPFTATNDCSVLGIKPIPHIGDMIKKMLDHYVKECMDIEDVEYEPADIEEEELFPEEEEQTDETIVTL